MWLRAPAPLVRAGAVLLLSLLSPAPARAQLLGLLDQTPPDITIVAPAAGSTVSGQVSVQAAVSDGLVGTGVESVAYQVNGTLGAWTPMAFDALSARYSASWNTLAVHDGSFNVYVRATDRAGNMRTAYVPVRVRNPPAMPTGLTVSAPAPSQGTTLSLRWDANGEADLSGYTVYRSTQSGGPYQRLASPRVPAFEDTGLTPGTIYHYVVSAVDTAANESPRSLESSGRPLDTLAPTLSELTVTAVSGRQVDVRWRTDEGATTQVEWGTTSSLGSSSALDGNLVREHLATLSGLTPGTTYHYRVHSTDARGNASSSPVSTFSTPQDVAPTVSIVSPTHGSLVSGTVTLSAAAADDVRVASVEYTVDGFGWAPLPYNSLSGRYEVRLDSATLGEGPHQLAVLVTDTSNQTAMDVVEVMVDGGAPLLSLVSPEEGAHLLAGSANVFSAHVSDGSGVAAVEWQLYLVPPDVELEGPPPADPAAWQPMTYNPTTDMYEVPWTAPLVVTEAVYYFYVQARDNAGRISSTVRELSVAAVGREFSFIGASGQTLFGTVAIEPIGPNGENVIGIEVRALDATPGGRYVLTVSGEGASHSVEVVADGRGRGDAVLEENSSMTDEQAANVSLSGPGF